MARATPHAAPGSLSTEKNKKVSVYFIIMQGRTRATKNKVILFIMIVMLIGVFVFLLRPQLTGNVIAKNDTSSSPLRTVLTEGEAQEIAFGEQHFIVSVVYVGAGESAKLQIRDDEGNEFVTPTMSEGEAYRIGDGIIMQLDNVFARNVVTDVPQVFISIWNKNAFLCTDTDGGQKYDLKGVLLLKGGKKKIADFCWYPFSFVNRFILMQKMDEPSDTLFEYYCVNDRPASEKIECRCENGRCVAEEEEK